MGQGFDLWSTTAATNATVDSSINWAEGMAPSAVNDSARAMMARLREWGNDIAGSIAAGGSTNALTVASSQGFTSLSNLNNQVIAFTASATNTAAVTLAVDGLTAKPLRFGPGLDLPSGTLIASTPYVAIYNNSNGEFYLQNSCNPYGIPIGGILPYTGSTAPSSAFVLPAGQAISRTTYATYFSLVSTTFGTGDGSTTFNIPDLRGRFLAALDNLNGTAANRITSAGSSITGTTLGATGGAQNETIGQANLPNVNFAVTIGAGQGSHNHGPGGGEIAYLMQAGGGNSFGAAVGTTWGAVTNTGDATLPSMTGTAASGGSGTALVTMPPTIVLGMILRVI